MDCFNQAIIAALLHEGGFSNHDADPGGATNYGISLRWLKSQGLYGDMDDDGDVDIDDIKALDQETASRMYREKWWDKYHYDRIVDCEIATKMLDISINMGGSRAHHILQDALNSLGETLVVDGIIGPRTITATNTVPVDPLLDAIRSEQRRFYLRIIEKRPALAVFRKGWLRRAEA
jgi:lysozyme family protein